MPTITSTTPEEQNDANQKMRNALRRYIIRERQRKKEEYEAEVEEERLRKEREARERQDVMTLEETKEQIDQLDIKLKQLEKEKQQLFMELKRVLNEDEIRKRQHQRETNEMQPMKMPMGNMPMPMFPMPTSTGQGEPAPNQGRPPPLTTHGHKNKHSNYMFVSQQQSMVRGPMQSSVKRPRSPSPTYALYTHRLHQPPMKHHQVYSDHKVEDGRMGRQMARAVLWNKSSQYASGVSGSSVQSGAYYAMPSSGVVVTERPPPLLYAQHPHTPHAHTPHTPHTLHQPHHTGMLYAPAQQHMYLDNMMKRDGQQQPEQKKEQPQVLIGLSEAHHPSVSSGVVYSQPPPSTRHLALHPSGSAPQLSNIQSAKPGSITQGYPVQQSNQNVQNPNIYPNRHRY